MNHRFKVRPMHTLKQSDIGGDRAPAGIFHQRKTYWRTHMCLHWKGDFQVFWNSMMFTNERLLKYLTINIVLFLNFTFGTEILAHQGVHPRFSKSTSSESVNIKCVLDGCSLSDVISVLENQHVSFVCNLTTSNAHQEHHALQLILVDVEREFVLGDDSCRWQRRQDEESDLYCDLQVAQKFVDTGEKYLAYLVSPLDYYGNFTVTVVKADQTSECKAPIERHLSTVRMITKRTQPSVQLYAGDEVPESGPSLMGKVIVGGIGLVLIIIGFIILKRYCQENRRETESSSQKEEATHMIVYKTQPTWCQEPESDSDIDQMEPFLSHDSDG